MGEGFFWQLRVESFPHFGKEQIKRRKTGASNIQAHADRCKQRQTESLVDVTHLLDNNISPPKFNWSAKPKCWPRPIDQSAPHFPELFTAIDLGQLKPRQWLSQTLRNRTQVILLSVQHSHL